MASYESKQKLYACYLDLRRAAVSFYKAPEGHTHVEFLVHALKILNELKGKKPEKFKKEILSLRKATLKDNYSERERMNIADKILTTGILLKS